MFFARKDYQPGSTLAPTGFSPFPPRQPRFFVDALDSASLLLNHVHIHEERRFHEKMSIVRSRAMKTTAACSLFQLAVAASCPLPEPRPTVGTHDNHLAGAPLSPLYRRAVIPLKGGGLFGLPGNLGVSLVPR